MRRPASLRLRLTLISLATLVVWILESVFEGVWDRRLLEFLDPLANRLRSGGRMQRQEEHLRFRAVPDWLELFPTLGGRLVTHRTWGGFFHRQALFVVEPE